jgi:hypothetical protein
MIRDLEFDRLIHYAKGLGIKVTVYEKSDDSALALWVIDGSEILVYKGSTNTKIRLVLALIHEISHHLWFVHDRNREIWPEFDEAVTLQGAVDRKERKELVPKHLRKAIRDMEHASLAWWEIVYKETNMKFPLWRLAVEQAYDYWIYENYYENGTFAKKKDSRKYLKELQNKHKPKR